jgi:hypothetical protein
MQGLFTVVRRESSIYVRFLQVEQSEPAFPSSSADLSFANNQTESKGVRLQAQVRSYPNFPERHI